jgi:protocatechuate 3,4-dioxygenase beta subunit
MNDNKTRRDFLRASMAAAAPLAVVLGGGYVLRFGALRATAQPSAQERQDMLGQDMLGQDMLGQDSQQLQLTPACVDDDDVELTPAQTEGPYFTPNSPERTSLLEPDMAGTPLTVTGNVLSTTCQPVAGALLDFWHADDSGEYDNIGYRLRGHQFTDSAGRYTLETIVPGLYTGRTRHIHLKVQSPNAAVLTTQLYFPADAAQNARDGIYSADLLMDIQEGADGRVGRFDFVVTTA